MNKYTYIQFWYGSIEPNYLLFISLNYYDYYVRPFPLSVEDSEIITNHNT